MVVGAHQFGVGSRVRQPFVVGMMSSLLLSGVQMLEVASGPEVTMSLFYLIPVLLMTWHAGPLWGVATAAVAISAWHLEDVVLLNVSIGRPVQCINSLLRSVLFGGVVALLHRLHIELDRAKASSARKSEMVSLVSHEFNGAITCIDTALFILGRSVDAPQLTTDMADTIKRTTTRLKMYVSNYLALSRLESGPLKVAPEPLDAVAVASEHLDMCALVASREGVHLSLEAPSSAVAMRADKSVVSLALSNLLSNAVKYTPSGGAVTLRVTPISSGVRFEVADTGMGISPQDARRLTEAFFRTDAARRGKHAGHGVGLRVTQQMLQAHGSNLEVQSIPGEGCTFAFTISP